MASLMPTVLQAVIRYSSAVWQKQNIVLLLSLPLNNIDKAIEFLHAYFPNVRSKRKFPFFFFLLLRHTYMETSLGPITTCYGLRSAGSDRKVQMLTNCSALPQLCFFSSVHNIRFTQVQRSPQHIHSEIQPLTVLRGNPAGSIRFLFFSLYFSPFWLIHPPCMSFLTQ